MELVDLKLIVRKLMLGTALLLLLLTTVWMCVRTTFEPPKADGVAGPIQDMLAKLDTTLLRIGERSLPTPPLRGLKELRVKKTEPAPPMEEKAVELMVQAAAKEAELTVSAIAGDRSNQVALVNNTLVGLNESIEGLTVTSITQDRVVFEDEKGNRREVNVYGRLEKYDQ